MNNHPAEPHGNPGRLLSFTMLLTGLPGAGKTTLLAALSEEMERRGNPVVRLDSDNIPWVFVKHLGAGEKNREIRVRFLAFAAYHLNRQGVSCVLEATCPRAETRRELRAVLDPFIEVFVRCPIEVVEQRDPKRLYAMARAGLIANFTGVDAPYEEPEFPEIVVATDGEPVDQAIFTICDYLVGRGYLTP
jgi:adenylylsulfate kinase